MPATDGSQPVGDDEILYRRIPASMGWYDPTLDPAPSPEAFAPRKDDENGLSLTRADLVAIEVAACGASRKGYYVAKVRAGDLRAAGLEITPIPRTQNPGHAVIPLLKYSDRETDAVKEWKTLLAHKLCKEIAGPFIVTPPQAGGQQAPGPPGATM
jgi:hypothetical protein